METKETINLINSYTDFSILWWIGVMETTKITNPKTIGKLISVSSGGWG